MSLRIKKNDTVVVLTGRSKGRKGRVMRVEGERVFIEGVNLIKRYARKTRQNPQGGLIEQEASLHISNVSLIQPGTTKPERFRVQVLKDGSKERVGVKSEQILDKAK